MTALTLQCSVCSFEGERRHRVTEFIILPHGLQVAGAADRQGAGGKGQGQGLAAAAQLGGLKESEQEKLRSWARNKQQGQLRVV